MNIKFLRRLAIVLPLILVLLVLNLQFAKPATASTSQQTTWVLQWSDEFSGAANTGVNTANWLYDTGHCYPGCPAANWGTGEIENMTTSTANVYQDGAGHLVIKPIKDAAGNWSSGRIETQRTDFQPPAGGKMRIEGSLQQPNVSGAAAAGYWPAFWSLGAPFRGVYTNWPSVGELDIMEDINGLSSVFGTLHCGVSPGGPCNETTGIGSGQRACTGCQTGYHTYAVELDRSISPQQLRFYLDGSNYFTINSTQVDATTWNNATNHGFFVILNVAIGGGFPAAFGGGPTASTVSGIPMLVDYVRVYYSSTGTAPTPTRTNTPIGPTSTPSASGNGNPYGGTAAAIPGTVQAENYNTGGEGVAYHDAEATNQGGQYRTTEGVDIEACTDTGAGYNVGWTAAGEWMKYTVNVTSAGTYNLGFRLASAQAGGSFHLEVDGANVTGAVAVPNTGGWQTWTTVTKSNINLSAGTHVLRWVTDAAGGNYNNITFTKVTTTVPTNTPAPAGDYTQGVTRLNTTQAQIWFKPTIASAWVDVHYLINGVNQQNFRMTNNAGTWQQTVSNLTTGNVIQYWFTYEKSGLAYDSVHYSYTQ